MFQQVFCKPRNIDVELSDRVEEGRPLSMQFDSYIDFIPASIFMTSMYEKYGLPNFFKLSLFLVDQANHISIFCKELLDHVSDNKHNGTR